MTRAQLEHLLRAAAAVVDDDEIVVIGSQAVLGQFPGAPPEMVVSMEADLFPRNHPERSDLIDGSIGELSPFHGTFGHYAEGVSPNTATLPHGWEQRLVVVPVGAFEATASRSTISSCRSWPRGRRKTTTSGGCPFETR